MTQLQRYQKFFSGPAKFFPGWASRVVAKLFLMPAPRAEASAWPAELTQRTQSFSIRFGPRNYPGWSWGSGPRILLAHGWGGNAESLKTFILPLVEAGFAMVAFDGPGHGAAKERTTNVLEFSRFLIELSHQYGPFTGVLGHSFGASSALYAMSLGWKVSRAVFLAPFTKSDHNFERFAQTLSVPPRIRDRARQRLLRFFGEHAGGWDLLSIAAGIPTEVLIVHDGKDAEVPFEDSVELAAALPYAKLHQTEKLGHRRIIRSEEVARLAASFFSRGI